MGITIVRTNRGALDTRRMGIALALDPQVQPTLDAIGGEAQDTYQAPDLGALDCGALGESLSHVSEAAASEVHGSRAAIAQACLTYAASEARKAARKAVKASVRAFGRGALALPSGE